MKQLRVLITGASGFIGGNLMRHFHNRGWAVHAHGGRSRFEFPPPGASISHGDISQHTSDWPAKVDLVVHAAGWSQFSGMSDEALLRGNIGSTQAVMEYAHRAGRAKIIFISAVSAFGAVSVPCIDEDTPPIAPDAYGESKLACERILAASVASGISSLALRIPGIVGQGAWTPWISRVLSKLRLNEPVPIYSPEFLFNNIVHVLDLSEFIEKLATSAFSGFDLVVLGADGAMPVESVVEFLKRKVSSSSVITRVPAPRSPFILFSQKAEKCYDYRPAMVLDILRRYAHESG